MNSDMLITTPTSGRSPGWFHGAQLAIGGKCETGSGSGSGREWWLRWGGSTRCRSYDGKTSKNEIGKKFWKIFLQNQAAPPTPWYFAQVTSALADQKSYTYLMASLSERERLYVQARALGSTPLAAATTAGFNDPVSAAVEKEKNLNVRTSIEYAIKMAARASQLTRDDVLAGLQDAVRMAGTATELVMAWREIGRIIGAYEPIKIKHDHTHRLTQEQVKSMEEEELANLAAIDGEFVVLED